MLLLFDAVLIAGVATHSETFSRRLSLIAMALEHSDYEVGDAVQLKLKMFLNACVQTADDIQNHLSNSRAFFRQDGIVLYPEEMPIVFGRHRQLYKLKNHGDHTVDFIVTPEDPFGLAIYDKKRRKNVVVAKLVNEREPPPPGCVLECRHVVNDDWELVGARLDKTQANDSLTFQKTVLNIQENISLQEVLAQFPPQKMSGRTC
jgi:hypothetical protein